MNNPKAVEAPPTAPAPDLYMQTLRKTLEHITDAEWLSRNSPLASVFFAGASASTERQRQVVLTGRAELDRRLRAIWHAWEQRSKTPLQSLVWEAVCRLPANLEDQVQAILLLTYFDDEQPKQSQVVKTLAIGRSTYYRHLERAIEMLGHAITHTLRPVLRLEQPTARPLVGRQTEMAQAQRILAQGGTIHLVGGSGLGKTLLGATLATRWPHGVFWYTFRLGVTDSLEQLLFAVAYFLHEQGASGLWLYLTTSAEPPSLARALLALRQHWVDQPESPSLFCFDEVDLLLADELHSSPEHLRIRQLLEEWNSAQRAGSPLLLIGQKLLLEPEAEGLIQLTPFTAADMTLFFKQTKLALTPAQCDHLLTVTRGNPLLLRLFLALHQRSSSLIETVAQLTTPVALDWFVARLTYHLSPGERLVLQELVVFVNGAPPDLWRRGQKRLEKLIELGLIEQSAASVNLHPALRKVLYDHLPATRKVELHLAAAQLLAERGRFTDAAWHYIQGERSEMAVWTWYTYQQEEIEQGQASTALALFLPLVNELLPRPDDQRALVLLLAPLLKRVGRAGEALALLEESHWPAQSVSAALAHELRGDLLAEMGQVERGLAEMRRGLENFSRLRKTQEVELYLQMGRRALARLGDVEQTRRHVAEARVSLDVLQGRLAEATGNYACARTHFESALTLAQQTTDPQRLAKIHEGLGVLEARYANLESAVEHLAEAGQLYRAGGNQIAAVGITNSLLAMAYLIKRRHAEAVAPAETARTFFAELNHVYWVALNETYLAEAWLYLGDLAKAEAYAQSALHHEEVMVRPYCLFLLGHVRRRQRAFNEAAQLCHAAIDEAQALHDLSAEAPAWLALAETARDAGQLDEAGDAFERAIALYERLGVEQEITYAEQLRAEMLQPA